MHHSALFSFTNQGNPLLGLPLDPAGGELPLSDVHGIEHQGVNRP